MSFYTIMYYHEFQEHPWKMYLWKPKLIMSKGLEEGKAQLRSQTGVVFTMTIIRTNHALCKVTLYRDILLGI